MANETGNTRVERNRRGEKIGWVGGWLGGFIWVGVLALVWFWQGKLLPGAVALGLFCLAIVLIFLTAPWRYPATPCYKLMLPLYGVLFAAVLCVFWGFGGFVNSGLQAWNFFWVILLVLPLFTMGRKRWSDGQ